MSFFLPTAGPGDGLFPADYIVIATNRTADATVAGEVVMFDLAQSNAAVDNSIPGSSDASGNNSAYNNFIDPAITGPFIKHYFYGLVLDVLAVGAAGRVLVRGRGTAHCATATAVGTALVANADGEMDVATGATDTKVLAIAEAADTALFAPVIFDGIHGFGSDLIDT